jgi:hypothetical protein
VGVGEERDEVCSRRSQGENLNSELSSDKKPGYKLLIKITAIQLGNFRGARPRTM